MIACLQCSSSTLRSPGPSFRLYSSGFLFQQLPSPHHPFLCLLPAIQSIARYRLRRLRSTDRDDAIQEVIANAFVAYAKLLRSGREQQAFASSLTEFGIRQYWSGRRVGSRTNSRDVLSEACQKRRHLKVGSLSHFEGDHWRELLLEDRRAGPAETALIRIDFRNWLNSLTPIHRQYAEMLATGENTNDVARKFHVTPARVSQIRRFLQRSWQEYQGEPELRAA